MVIWKEHDHRLLQFMMKLSDKFATVRGNIIMQQPLSSISSAFRMFSQEERHQDLSSLTNQTESFAFMADSRINFKSNPQKSGSYPKNIFSFKCWKWW